ERHHRTRHGCRDPRGRPRACRAIAVDASQRPAVIEEVGCAAGSSAVRRRRSPPLLPQTWPAILSLGWILLVIAAAKGMMVLFSLAADDGMAEDFAISAIVTLLVGGACVLTTKGRPFQLRFR